MSDFYDNLETRNPEKRDADQFEKLRVQIEFAQKNTAYGDLLSDVNPAQVGDAISLASLPVTRKSELIKRQKSTPPFGGLASQKLANCRHIFASPGPIYEPEGYEADYWRMARALHAAGFRAGDIAYNTFSYHFTPAGAMLESGAQALGCAVFPAGPAQTDLQIQTINDLQPSAFVGTPSFLRLLIDKSRQKNTPIDCFSKALVSGEALPNALREGLADDGIAVFQCYATADLGLIAYESSALQGLIVDEGVLLEIVRPGTGDPVSDGEVGEVVVTPLDNHSYPLIRFATGDLSAFMETTSPCGRTNRRIKGWMGRADQTTKVRGMFIHPEQVERVRQDHPKLVRIRLRVERVKNNDEMTLLCESTEHTEGLATAVSDSVRAICKLRATIEFTPPGSLPNDGKVIDDTRPID